jgi:hypothetical protein
LRVIRILAILTMFVGLTIFVVGVFVVDRTVGLIVSLLGIAVMLAGVAVTNYTQGSDLGPDF